MTDSKAIVPTSPLEIEAPSPNSVFINRVINPRNISITEEAQAKRDKPLSRSFIKKLRKAARKLTSQLQAAGYHEARTTYEDISARFLEYRLELRTLDEGGEKPSPELETRRREIITQMNALHIQARQLREQIKDLVPVARKHRAMVERLEEHNNAIEQRRLHTMLRKELAKEVSTFEELIIERWSQLGHKHETMNGKKHRVHKVQFSEIHVTPDQIFMKIDASMKTFLGFKSTLPQGVKAMELIHPDTLTELSISCQRQIQGKHTMNNGAWVIINRLGTRDGLLNYVTLEQVLNKYDHINRQFLPVPAGVGFGRVIHWIHVTRHPHFLIGGSTGGGKSNIENVIICTLIQKHSPSEIRFVLIDLKEGLEFRTFERIPHLLIPPIVDVQEAAKVLGQLETLRKERAEKFASLWARTLDEYNARVPEAKRMPRIIVIFDEFAAIATNKEAAGTINKFIHQLLNKGRATGIHVVICTQNPSVDIVSGPQKANMAFRLAGPMPTKSASMTILGTGDAADLPDIPGRMIAMVGARMWQIQTPHVRPQDIQYALEVADEWPACESIELPEASGVVGFNEETLIDIALSDFNGRLSARRIYEAIKDTETISYNGLRAMVKDLVAKKQIEFGGVTYGFKKNGAGWSLDAN
jgi:DNA segregation ATPase FtsK/SpoIIIE-like protein